MVNIKIALVNPLIPQNTGNIARLCAANGFELHLIGKLGFSLDDKHLKRAGLDYWEHVRLFLHDSLVSFLEEQGVSGSAPGTGFFLFSKKAVSDLFDADFRDGDILVFGPEDKGFSDQMLEQYRGHTIRIPMQTDDVRSLNLSSAVAVASYEAMRKIRRIQEL